MQPTQIFLLVGVRVYAITEREANEIFILIFYRLLTNLVN
jgi:hypothetical protein